MDCKKLLAYIINSLRTIFQTLPPEGDPIAVIILVENGSLQLVPIKANDPLGTLNMLVKQFGAKFEAAAIIYPAYIRKLDKINRVGKRVEVIAISVVDKLSNEFSVVPVIREKDRPPTLGEVETVGSSSSAYFTSLRKLVPFVN